MMDLIFNLMPWWGWLVVAAVAAVIAIRLFGFNAAIAVLVAGAAAAVYAKGRKAGVTVERAKQDAADNHARDVIHEKKEDVRSIPDTPAGKAERDERFNRWL